MNHRQQKMRENFNPSGSADTCGRVFREYLTTKLDAATARAIVRFFKKMRLPLPEHGGFMRGTEGALIFSNLYGVVIRIERKNPYSIPGIVRCNDNPMILQPLGSFPVADAVIEICPGCHAPASPHAARYNDSLCDDLHTSGIIFMDPGEHNIGMLPFKTPVFPEGVPVVIDRLAVTSFSRGVNDAKAILEKIGVAEDPQKTLYAPLSKALAEAWPEGDEKPDAKKLRDFWAQCADFVREGKLVAGWNEPRADTYKQNDAQVSAVSYDRLLEKHYFESSAARRAAAARAASNTP